MTSSTVRPLQRILGVGFGLAVGFGGTVGVGILRLPGTLAAALGDARLVLLFWIVGGLYVLLGAVAVAELAAMLPAAGGFYVYARRAFGDRGGFVIGWSDWIVNCSAGAYVSMVAASYLGALWAPAAANAQWVALSVLASFTAMHWIGLRLGRTVTSTITVSVGIMLLLLVIASFLTAPAQVPQNAAPQNSAASLPLLSMAMIAAAVTAMRSVLAAFDGWYGAIYVAGESADPSRTLPRAIIGGTLLIAVLYLVINIAFVRVLPLPVLAASQLPAADVANIILPRGGAVIVTVISLGTMFSVLNVVLIGAPRILVGLARDGLGVPSAGSVSASGTPRFALGLTSLAAAFLIVTGTFEQIVALGVVLFVFNYISAYASVFVLRRREPTLARPYRAIGYPLSTAIVLVGSVLFLVAAVTEDRRSAIIVVALFVASIPAYALTVRGRNSANATS